jgi:D-alanyl-D-alanine carboxypeptidase
MADFQAVFSRLNTFVSQRMWEGQIPGLALALTNREETLYVSTYGFSDLATRAPVKLETLFEIGSISKSFTSAALLQLHEAGRLDLHKPVQDYLPWFDVKSPHKPITIHHLLSHTGGIAEGNDLGGDPRYEIYALRETEICMKPGATFHYSNLGYRILGVVLEEILGQSYGDIIQARLLDPLHMTHAEPAITHETRRRLAAGHVPFHDDRPAPLDGALVAAPWLETDTGDGSIAATPSDLVNFLRMLLNRGQSGILSDASFNLMSRPIVKIPGKDVFYGYGLMVSQMDGFLHVSHTGTMVGYTCAMLGDVDNGVGAVVMTNHQNGNPLVVAEFAVRALRAAQNRLDLPVIPPVSQPHVIENAQDYVGTYTGNGRTFTISAESGALVLQYDNEYIFMEQRGEDSFFVNHDDFRLFLLTFGRAEATDGEPGAVVELSYGPDWYTNARYTGPDTFDYPPEWTAFSGHYRSHNPWLSNFRVVLLKGDLLLVYPTTGERLPLVPVDEQTFRVGTDNNSPERIRFDTVVDGKALRAMFNLGSYYRCFTP